MPLPPVIEIQSLSRLPECSLVLPGSKSITNRALILAALGSGQTLLQGALWSEDTQIMVEALKKLGLKVEVTDLDLENSNCHIRVSGCGGRLPSGLTLDPIDLYVGNAGTASRFLTAFACLGHGRYRLSGTDRMHERPQAGLFHALRTLGYQVDSDNDRLPAVVHGGGAKPGRCTVSIDDSSQFASALILAAETAGWEVEVEGENTAEAPYAMMTRELCRQFPKEGGIFQIEADASSGSYFCAINWLFQNAPRPLQIDNWPKSRLQIDARFPDYWPLPGTVSRATDLGDSIMTAIVVAPFASHPTQFTHLGGLREQECERVSALRAELTRCGAQVIEEMDTLALHPSAMRGAEIETYQDHRMAMCFAILGLRVPGMRIRNPSCVKKTFPHFFRQLAETPPHGLGAVVRDSQTGETLPAKTLLAT